MPAFFNLNALYTITPGASLKDLAEDAEILLGAGLNVFEEKVEEIQGITWAGIYCLRQALAIAEELTRRMPEGLCEAGGPGHG